MAPSVTSSERVIASVREMILDGRLAAGARLGEVELADRLGVSRTPVREALSRLGAEGLVELSPNRGARVATWSRSLPFWTACMVRSSTTSNDASFWSM